MLIETGVGSGFLSAGLHATPLSPMGPPPLSDVVMTPASFPPMDGPAGEPLPASFFVAVPAGGIRDGDDGLLLLPHASRTNKAIRPQAPRIPRERLESS